MNKVTARPMFGYQCYSVSRKFFVGFSNKNDYQIIVRLPKAKQESAIAHDAIEPFSHGAKMGWIEIDSTKISNASMVMKLVILAQDHVLNLVKNIESLPCPQPKSRRFPLIV